MSFKKKLININFFNKYFLIFIIFLSLISLINNCIKALNWSADFQWHPSTLLLKGINHYQYFLNGGVGFLSQLGEYGHGLYVILLPYALMDWNTAKFFWMITNVTFIFLIPILICRKFNISNSLTIIIICIFATSSPTRTCINYGQQSLFIMFFFILPFIFNNGKSAFFSGVSYVKYSVGYVIPIYFLVSKKYKFFVLSTILSILSWVIYSIMTDTNLLISLFEPLQLGLGKNYARGTDFYSLVNSLNLINTKFYNTLFSIILSIIVNTFIIFKISKMKDDLLKLSLICLSVVVFAPHSNYDYVFLLPLMIFSLKNIQNNKLNLILIIFYFYFSKLLKHKLGFDSGSVNLYDTLIFLCFFCCLIFNTFNKKLYSTSKT